MKARHWIHCTNTFRGERWEAERRAPVLVGEGEPKTPRLCVAPTVSACFAARLFTGDVCVYRTERDRRAVAPVGVWDATITGERWLIPPVAMVLTHVVPAGVVERATRLIRWHLEETRTAPDLMVRLLAYREAVKVLREQGPEFAEDWEWRFVRRAIRSLQEGECAA